MYSNSGTWNMSSSRHSARRSDSTTPRMGIVVAYDDDDSPPPPPSSASRGAFMLALTTSPNDAGQSPFAKMAWRAKHVLVTDIPSTLPPGTTEKDLRCGS